MPKDNENNLTPLEELPLTEQIARIYGLDPNRKNLFTPSWQRKPVESNTVLTSKQIAAYIEDAKERADNLLLGSNDHSKHNRRRNQRRSSR